MHVFEKTQVIFILLIVGILSILVWSNTKRINDFKDYHYLIADNSVRNVSESISQFINERKRLIQVFANKHKQLIKKSALEPDNDQLKSKLESQVRNYFPGFFSFTITNENGKPYYDDFDGVIGDLCLSDIKTFVDENISSPRVHPHHVSYHYDLLASLSIKDKKFIFFISFPADEISSYLKSAEAIGHTTILVLKEFENIIEVTVEGARNKNFRKDYRLADNELSYLLSEKDIMGSSWTIYDMHEPDLFFNYIKQLMTETIFIILIFGFVGIILYLQVKKEEKKRKKAEAIKNEFVTVVSHELRTPLTSISGAIKLIENEALGPINNKIKEYLNMASNNIDRLTNIVNDILDVKKMESGEFNLFRENISLVNLVEQAINENHEYAQKFNAELVFIKPDKDYIVCGDKDRLLQVMANLLSNAVKYGSKEEHVKIYFKELAKGIRVNIEDHGEGIAEKNKEILFEKFTQFHSRDSEIVKGTGLGLNIVKTIIDGHKGMVSFETAPNKGTTFYFILPLVV